MPAAKKKKQLPAPPAVQDGPSAGGKKTVAYSWVLGLVLAGATILAYQPAWNGGFIWDDDAYVTDNPLLKAPDGLRRIWFSLDAPSQYFPLTYTTLRLEWGLWGANPTGYHWVNLLLHAANALLVWRVLSRLTVPGAWLAAALFALHPVQVESVAWITERKNVLSLLFSLLSVLAWIRFVEGRSRSPWKYYALALASYLLALFSKTTACTLPAALVLVLWLKHKPLSASRWKQLVPFVLLAVGMGLVTVWWEHVHQGVGPGLRLSLACRTLVAAHALWFYLGKLVWPAHLLFSYPRWQVEPAVLSSYGWLVALGGLAALVWRLRRFWGRALECALLFYVATLSPLLGFIMLYTFHYSFVADHYQYVASIGPLALAAAGINSFLSRLTPSRRTWGWAGCGALLAGLWFLTWQQSHIYRNSETLWRATLSGNPTSGLAHFHLGKLAAQAGNKTEALDHFQAAMAGWEPALVADLAYDVGNLLMRSGWAREAADWYQITLRRQPRDFQAHVQLGKALFEVREVEPAIAQFRQGLDLSPGSFHVLSNLAVVTLTLATSSDPALRNPARAVALAEELDPSLRRANPLLGAHILATAYSAAGRFSDAAAATRRALDLVSTQGNASLIQALSFKLDSYQARLTNAPFPQSADRTNGPLKENGGAR